MFNCETLLELLHGPFFSAFAALLHGIRIIASCVYLFNRSGSYRKQFDLPTCLLLVTRPLSLLQPGEHSPFYHMVAFNDQQDSALGDYP